MIHAVGITEAFQHARQRQARAAHQTYLQNNGGDDDRNV